MTLQQPPNIDKLSKTWQRYIRDLEQQLDAARTAQAVAEQVATQTYARPGAPETKVFLSPGGMGLAKDFQPMPPHSEVEFRNLHGGQYGTDLQARINSGGYRRADRDWLEISADNTLLVRPAGSNRVLIRAEGFTK